MVIEPAQDLHVGPLARSPIFDVELGGVFPIPTPRDWATYENGKDVDEPRSMRPLRYLERGDWLELSNAPNEMVDTRLGERGRRRMVSIAAHDTTMKLEFRRRDVKYGKKIRNTYSTLAGSAGPVSRGTFSESS